MIEDEKSKGGRDRRWNLLMNHALEKVEVVIGISSYVQRIRVMTPMRSFSGS
jgi:hypothetical protein